MDNHEVLAKGICERIGFGGHMRHSVAGKVVFESDVEMPDHSVAVENVLKELTDSAYGVISDMGMVDAVGHRVLHGGSKFSGSMIVTPDVEAAIEECIPLGPLHNPANLMGIRACQKVMPGVPQVAVSALPCCARATSRRSWICPLWPTWPLWRGRSLSSTSLTASVPATRSRRSLSGTMPTSRKCATWRLLRSSVSTP